MPKDEIRRRVTEAAKILDIEYLLERRPKALSGGQRQRVALGRAMVRNPQVFLLDEPLSNLDAKLRTAMRSEIIKLHKSLETTFVYVTHDQIEAMTMGDRIVVMKDGFIQQVDTPQNLYRYPCNLFVAGFIGAPQMNFLDAKVKAEGENITVDFGGSYQFALTGETAQSLKTYAGKDVVAGIRPEDLKINNTEEFSNYKAKALVEITELMGSEIYVYFDCYGHKLICKTSADTIIKSDSEIEIAFNINKMHFFDKETEAAICH
jgi:multiple sugar transport system ATP-binding protein